MSTKVETAHAFLEHLNDLKQIFQMTSFGGDHTKPSVKLHKTLETEDLQKMIERLATVKSRIISWYSYITRGVFSNDQRTIPC